MNYIVYISSGNHLFSEFELVEILTVSRANNEATNITGMLLYHDGAFMQILEGDKHSLDQLFEKLLDDRRHHSVLKMFEGTGSVRHFKDWTMGFTRLETAEWLTVTGYFSPQKFDTDLIPAEMRMDEVSTLVKSFIQANFSGIAY